MEESDGEDVDDIDKLRDDLQSTKQMLALELRNKEAQDRENKRLLARIQALEAELGNSKPAAPEGAAPAAKPADDALVKTLKTQAEDAQKTSKALEKKYQDVAEQLDKAKLESEEQKRKIANLEKQIAQGGVRSPIEYSHNIIIYLLRIQYIFIAFWANNLNSYKLHNGNGYHHSYTNGFHKSACNNDYENDSWSGDSSHDFWEEIHVNHSLL